ncbi:MAG: manganese efflux pump [Oscillospiraceae bacterium]|nr:manganese efflux pump [Oscillospiraceae bacterium]
MSFFELFILAVGLSMDAFAVAVCKGLAQRKTGFREILIPGLWFGAFQALMPLLGWLLGARFERYIVSVDHWIAFVLLAGIGVNMLREARREEEKEEDASLAWKVMLPLALATSIDALAVGITFAFLRVEIFSAVAFIGVTTFLLSMAGVKIGSIFGLRWRKGAQIAGGTILILLGLKILLEHLGVLPF